MWVGAVGSGAAVLATWGCASIVGDLLDRDVEPCGSSERLPGAAFGGDEEQIRERLQAGDDPDASSEAGYPLQCAA